jgi:hypothetical protein
MSGHIDEVKVISEEIAVKMMKIAGSAAAIYRIPLPLMKANLNHTLVTRRVSLVS